MELQETKAKLIEDLNAETFVSAYDDIKGSNIIGLCHDWDNDDGFQTWEARLYIHSNEEFGKISCVGRHHRYETITGLRNALEESCDDGFESIHVYI